MKVRVSSMAGIARARLNRAVAKHVAADFDAHGAEVVAKMRKEKPVDYLKMVSAILAEEDPSEAEGGANYNIIERRIIMPEPRDA